MPSSRKLFTESPLKNYFNFERVSDGVWKFLSTPQIKIHPYLFMPYAYPCYKLINSNFTFPYFLFNFFYDEVTGLMFQLEMNKGWLLL